MRFVLSINRKLQNVPATSAKLYGTPYNIHTFRVVSFDSISLVYVADRDDVGLLFASVYHL